MSTLRPRPVRRPRGRIRRRVAAAIVLVLVFAVGIALGEALEDHPRPGRTTTQERTFTVQPKQRTVTVTTP